MAEVPHLDHTHQTPTDDDQICDSRPHGDHLRVVAVEGIPRDLLVQPAPDVLIGPIEPTETPMDLPWGHQVEAQRCLLRWRQPCIPVNHPIKNPTMPPVPWATCLQRALILLVACDLLAVLPTRWILVSVLA